MSIVKIFSNAILYHYNTLLVEIPRVMSPLKPSGPTLFGTSNIEKQLIYCNISIFYPI